MVCLADLHVADLHVADLHVAGVSNALFEPSRLCLRLGTDRTVDGTLKDSSYAESRERALMWTGLDVDWVENVKFKDPPI